MTRRAERRRNGRNNGKGRGDVWLYVKPLDLVNKKATIQLGDRGGKELLDYLRYVMQDLYDRYGILNTYIETNVKESEAGKPTKEEEQTYRSGNSVV